jgi:succinoglycan biosynthesis transport protein ExoP
LIEDNKNNNNNHFTNGGEIEIDLRELIRVFRKRLRLIAIMTLLTIFCVAAVSTWVLQPVYQAQTLLMVTKATEKLQVVPSTSGNQLEDVVGVVSPIPVLTMSTYLGQIKSEALMSRIIEDLGLSCSAASLAGAIQAEVVKDSNLISVKVNNKDPVLASRIANSLSEQYLQLMTDKNQEQLNRSVIFLEKQRIETDKELQEAEEELEEFQSRPRGVAVLETEFNQKAESRANFDSQLQAARVELQQFSFGVARLQQELEDTSPVFTVEKWNEETFGIDYLQEVNPLYVSFAQELAVKQAALAEKQGQIAGLETLVAQMKTELDELQAELSGKRLQGDKLQREVDRLSLASETLARRSMEIQIAKSIDLGDTTVMVISEASLPSGPIKPNKKLNVAIAAVLGLMAFTLLAFVLEYLDNTIKTPEDVSSQLGLPVLGVIPLGTAATVKKSGYYRARS